MFVTGHFDLGHPGPSQLEVLTTTGSGFLYPVQFVRITRTIVIGTPHPMVNFGVVTTPLTLTLGT